MLLVGSVLRQNGYQVPNVTLPTRTRPKLNVPDSTEVKLLFNVVKNTRWEVPVLLAALGPLRRGEIVAASVDDLSGNILYVHRSAIINEKGKQIIKEFPKTDSSNRYIVLPDYLADKIRAQGYVTRMSLGQISDSFGTMLSENGLPPFRFHDLRHAFVLIAHAAGIPDAYIMSRGGWSTAYTMTNVYHHTLDESKKKMEARINSILASDIGLPGPAK